MTKAEFAVVYAALILQGDKVPITGDKVRKLLEAAKVKVEEYYVDLFVEYFENNDLAQFLKGTTFEPAKEEQKEKREEEADVELVGGFEDLFG
jgi:ribosomal protein L12E/L44/L45/RPP1/RPP2